MYLIQYANPSVSNISMQNIINELQLENKAAVKAKRTIKIRKSGGMLNRKKKYPKLFEDPVELRFVL